MPSPIDWCHDRLVQNIVSLDTLPMLPCCTLRGIYATETDFLAFIKRTRVSHLYLEHVTLSSGMFRSIFDYCTSAVTPVTTLNFFVLYERNVQRPEMLQFVRPGLSRLGHNPVGLGSESLERSGYDINRPISYHTPIPFPMGNPMMSEWVAFQRREYGGDW